MRSSAASCELACGWGAPSACTRSFLGGSSPESGPARGPAERCGSCAHLCCRCALRVARSAACAGAVCRSGQLPCVATACASSASTQSFTTPPCTPYGLSSGGAPLARPFCRDSCVASCPRSRTAGALARQRAPAAKAPPSPRHSLRGLINQYAWTHHSRHVAITHAAPPEPVVAAHPGMTP
ncbi:MAG: hypothetical protein J3K34DRAFT_227424 [Monoraphidium minutum]|nr:MAG: hypothetical protein J3K34DRAFT_227424 [Monoraphidium minutum]